MINADLNIKIHEVADVFNAMKKCISKNIYVDTNICCIFYKNGSHVAVATDRHIVVSFSMNAIEKAMEESNHNDFEVFELVAFHSNMIAIQYKNGIAFTTSKFYDIFISKIGKPISDNGEWIEMQYPDYTKIIPEPSEWGSFQENHNTVDPKILCLFNKIKNAYDVEKAFPSVENCLVEDVFRAAEKIEDGFSMPVYAVYPGLLFIAMTEPRITCNDVNKQSDLAFFKNSFTQTEN